MRSSKTEMVSHASRQTAPPHTGTVGRRPLGWKASSPMPFGSVYRVICCLCSKTRVSYGWSAARAAAEEEKLRAASKPIRPPPPAVRPHCALGACPPPLLLSAEEGGRVSLTLVW